MDRRLGLIHVRIQTWFPMPIQVYVNGHEWLARKLGSQWRCFTKRENVFLWIQDIARAQRFVDRFANQNWPSQLSAISFQPSASSQTSGWIRAFLLKAER